MLTGFNFTIPSDKQRTPYDFITDKKTGLRPTQAKSPGGYTKHDLTYSYMSYEGTTYPPFAIWEKGKWLSDMDPSWLDEFKVTTKDAYYYWVVLGEGTPGNYAFRLYRMPKDEATYEKARHPMKWLKKLLEQNKSKKYKTSSAPGSSGSTYKSSGSWYDSSPKSTLPLSVRFRCPGCGHWFDDGDLADHAKNVCPGVHGEDLTWAIMCDSHCGCRTLDDTTKCKPGYPKKPPTAAATNGEAPKDEAPIGAVVPTPEAV